MQSLKIITQQTATTNLEEGTSKNNKSNKTQQIFKTIIAEPIKKNTIFFQPKFFSKQPEFSLLLEAAQYSLLCRISLGKALHNVGYISRKALLLVDLR